MPTPARCIKRHAARLGRALYAAGLAALIALLLAVRGDVYAPGRAQSGQWRTPAGTLALQLAPGGGFAVLQGGETLFAAEPGWRVRGFLTGDLDADGRDELLLLVWRRGHYGPSRPFWVPQNDWRYSQHIFIYTCDAAGAVAPLWMSSGLDPQVRRWAMNADGTLSVTTPAGQDILWGWRSWGLERLDAPPVRL